MKRALAFTLMVLAIMIIAVSCEEPQAQVHEHTYAAEWTSDAEYHWHKATCEHTDEVSDKEEHTFGDWIIDEDSTEEKTGTKHRICSVCKYEEKGTVPLQGHVHTFSAYDNNGSKHWRTCTSCGEKFSYSHSFSYVDAGAKHYEKCYCGYSKSQVDHVYTDKKVLRSDVIYKVCDLCGNSDTKAESAEDSGTVVVAEVEDLSGKKSDNGKVTVIENGKEVTKEVKVITENVEIKVDATAETGTGTENKTTVTFPSGALKVDTNATSVSLIVETANISAASSANSGYQIETSGSDVTSGAVVAGFEFNLSNAVASDLTVKDKSGNITDGVKVTTFIAKNLEEENLSIKYLGESSGKEPEKVSYSSETGELVFKVYHFSRYAIVSTKVVATDNVGNMYESLEQAVNALGTKNDETTVDTIILLKDVSVEDYIGITKNVTLDGNNHTLTMGCKSKDYGASGLFITGEKVSKVKIKNITLEAGSNYPKQTALVYIHDSAAEVNLENVTLECNPDDRLSSVPMGIQSTYNKTSKISVRNCKIYNGKYGMYFNNISDSEIVGNTIEDTLYNGIVLAGDKKDEEGYKITNVTIKENTLTGVAKENYVHIAYNCGIYIGENTSKITVSGNTVTLDKTNSRGKDIIYYKDLITSVEDLKSFFGSDEKKYGYLYDDLELSQDVISTGTKVLDLCGNTIKTSGKITNRKDGDLTIKNGTIEFEEKTSSEMNAFDNEHGAKFTASGLTLDITFRNGKGNSGDLVGFYNVGEAVIADKSEISVKCVEQTESQGAGTSKVLGIYSYNGDAAGTTVKDSTIAVESASEASSYGFYMLLEESPSNNVTSKLDKSTVAVTQSTVGSVSPVFAESYDSGYQSIIDIINGCTIKGENTVKENEIKAEGGEGETSTATQKYVYAVRAKGNAVINIDSVSSAKCTVNSTDTEGKADNLTVEKLTINNSEVEGTIKTK